MDEMKINLSSPVTRTIISKLLSRYIRKALGIKPNIKLNDFMINTVNNKVHLHIDIDGIIDESSYLKILKKLDTD